MSAEVALLVESLVRASVGGSTHKVYLEKWNTWIGFMKKKERGPWLNLLDKSEVLTLLLEFMACQLFSFNNQQSTVRGYLAAIKFFSQTVPRVGADNFALYDRGSGKRDRQIPGDVRKERTSEVAADTVDLSSRIPYGHEFTGGRRRNVVRSGAVGCVRTIRVCEWARAPGLLFDARLPDFLSWRSPG